MNSKTYSVTIGIPAYNEAQNIEQLLESIITQTSSFYILEKIIVVSDGSTDETVRIAKETAVKHPRIAVVEHMQREGMAQRLNELYTKNESDILVTIEADLVLGNAYVIDEMVRHFDEEQVNVVAANPQPMKAETLTEHLVNAWYHFWYDVRKDYNNGDTIHNISGACLAIRKNFTSVVTYPVGTIASPSYLYFQVKTSKSVFYFAKEAVVYFYSPNNIHDYLLTLNRYSFERKRNAEIFGEWTYQAYKLPFFRKAFAFGKSMVESPIYMMLALLFHFWYKKTLTFQKSSVESKGLWQTVLSTKRRIKYPIVHGILHFS